MPKGGEHMTPIEKEYRSIATRIGCTLLIFSALTLIQSAVMAFLPIFTASLSAQAADIVSELLNAALYILVFTLPLLFFKMISHGYVVSAPRLLPELSGDGLCCALFGVAVTMALAFVNAKLVSVFDYGDFSGQYIWHNEAGENYQLILLFVSLAVVPAFVEELLFRGLILENLLPCGKTVAILGSAFLFGMMHQNVEQLLYATGAGIVFGWIYVRTRSLWPCVLAHFINNFQSVVQITVADRLPPSHAQAVLYVMEGMLLLLGILSAIFLFRSERQAACEQTENPPMQEVEEIPLRRRVRLFFSVPMTLFVLWCVANMLALIIMAIL